MPFPKVLGVCLLVLLKNRAKVRYQTFRCSEEMLETIRACSVRPLKLRRSRALDVGPIALLN